MAKETPCDYGECPYDAMYGETCRVYCGLGVDEACDEDDEGYELTHEEFEAAYKAHYGIDDEDRFYSPSAPWNAPGMSVKDFI